ncbi:MAG: alpha-hydroxy-acid oxidizing protein [Euryarchaeota archaeon]|nr:alpha-hydroxy-acid oxidizing protein [Euryarchaeota archaeon]
MLSQTAYDYVIGGSGDERSVRENEAGYARLRLVHRVLRDVSRRDCSTRVLGQRISLPAMVAPTAFHKLMHAEGEEASARGAAAAGTVFIASTLSNTSLEAIASAAAGPKWFQLYVYRDKKLTESLVSRAASSGYKALVLTVDTPTWGRRERDLRNRFTLPQGLQLANFTGIPAGRLSAAKEGKSGLAAYLDEQRKPDLTWADVEWLKDVSGLPIVLKGIVHPDDAKAAVEHGAAAIIVSNHGGRQLDAGVATIDLLPGVVAAVDGRCEVYVDGGVRRGTDVLIALALGADAVLIGRPILWSLAIAGEAGVERALRLLRDEFDSAMALAGFKSPDEVTKDAVRASPL